MNPALSLRHLPEMARVVYQAYGWKGLARRSLYELQLRSGYFERALPVQSSLTPAPSNAVWPLRFDLAQIRRSYEELEDLDRIRDQVIEEAERTLAGEMKFYGWAWKNAGWPPRWHTNAWSGYEYPRIHWTKISDFQPDMGDIKDVWEMSRWPFTYLLARAWVLTGADRYPEAWWYCVESWIEGNPPNSGVNWKCGQETALRGIALQFGLATFGSHPASTPQRLGLAAALLRASIKRVLPTLHYALSQRNNHAISESVFLETSAVPDVRMRAVARRARRCLREALSDQFYEDGWYGQHSFNYQRLALHALLWLDRVRSMAGLAVVEHSTPPMARSAALLHHVQDQQSGWLPNFGPDDGAQLFPLTIREHRDFRPLLANLARTLCEPARDKHGGATKDVSREGNAGSLYSSYDHEEALWLSQRRAVEPTQSPPPKFDHITVLAGPGSHAVVRMGDSRHRRSHDDLFHLDLWMGGENVLVDPGTFRYTAPTPWANGLARRAAHNAPTLSSVFTPKAGRFLSIAWPQCNLMYRSPHYAGTETAVFRGSASGIALHRTVHRSGDWYTVTDFADGHAFTTRWTFGTLGELLSFQDCSKVRAGNVVAHFVGRVEFSPGEHDHRYLLSGWRSDHYGSRRRVTAVDVRSSGPRLVACFGPAGSAAPLPI